MATWVSLPGLYESSCVLPVYVAGQRRSSPGLMLGFFCCRVMMEHAVDVDRYCSEVTLSSALDVMQRHTHTPA